MLNFVIPSLWGAIVWVVTVSLCLIFAPEVSISLEALGLIFYLVICYICSFIFFRQNYIQNLRFGVFRFEGSHLYLWFGVCTFLGWLGLYFYVVDFSGYLGGVDVFSDSIVNNPLEIRALAEQESSIGFQLSYFSWFSLFLGVVALVFLQLKLRERLVILFVIFVNLLANMMFIDRTRPTILILVSIFILLYGRMHFQRAVKSVVMLVAILPFAIFFGQVMYSGKFSAEDGLLKTLSIYLFGGFGYLTSLLEDDVTEVVFVRTFYPVAKFLNAVGFDVYVPSQILDFRYVPFPTNVGTFLEPLISDAGLAFALLFAPILIFAMDLVSLMLLRKGSVFGLILWANIVVVNIFGFFVSKYNNSYFYLLLVFVLSATWFSKVYWGGKEVRV